MSLFQKIGPGYGWLSVINILLPSLITFNKFTPFFCFYLVLTLKTLCHEQFIYYLRDSPLILLLLIVSKWINIYPLKSSENRKFIRFISVIEVIFFFYQGFLSRTLITHRTAGEGRGPPFIPPCHFHPLTNIQTFICNFAREMTTTCF